MNYLSGQLSSYSLGPFYDSTKTLIFRIHINTNRTRVSGNHMYISVNPTSKNSDSMERIGQYISNRFENLGGILARDKSTPNSLWVKTGKVVVGDLCPTLIEVSNCVNARIIIDDLFNRQEISASERADFENALREFEKSVQYASMSADKITVAQKDVIQSVISPYIDDIKAELPNKKTLRSFINIISVFLKTQFKNDPDEIKVHLPSILTGKYKNFNFSFIPENELKIRSDNFYYCLLVVAKFYTSTGSLEEALTQLGYGLPSESIIQQTILELFE